MELFLFFGIQFSNPITTGESLSMKKLLPILLGVLLFAGYASAQKLPKPSQLPTFLTDTQQQALQVGTKLHDSKQFDAAIAVYDKILADNPDAAEVIYEKSLSLYTKGDKEKAMETAYTGAKYKSDQLALFYTIMATCLDDVGKSDEAINIYRQAEDMLKSDIGMKKHLASVYYNLGVTYVGQKKYPEARAELKKAVENDFVYSSPHYLLSLVYNGTKYKVPAFLAGARFLCLEQNGPRAKNAALILNGVLQPTSKDPKTGNINIIFDTSAPKDEGDYTMYDLILGTLLTVKDDKDKGKSESAIFVEAVGTLVALIMEDKKIGSTFVGKNYVPFLADMKKNGYVEPFGYLILSVNGKQDATDWIKAHDAKFNQFIKWSKDYQLPK